MLMEVETGEFWLPLDEQTSVFNFLNGQASIEGKEHFLMFNSNINALLVYDLEIQNVVNRVTFPTEGPNAMPPLGISAGMKYVNSDTVIFFSKVQNRLYLTNLQGAVYKSINVGRDNLQLGSVDVVTPLAYRKGKLYIQLLPSDISLSLKEINSQPLVVTAIDLDTGVQKDHEIPFPDIYMDERISYQLKMVDIVYDQRRDKFVLSLPLQDEILLTNLDGSEPTYHSAKSGLVKDVELVKQKKNIPANQITSYRYWLSDAYGKLMYDQSSGYYFREARSGIGEEAYLNRSFKTKKEIVILGPDLNQVGVMAFEDGESILYQFATEGKLFLNRNFKEYNFERQNEDTLYFKSMTYID